MRYKGRGTPRVLSADEQKQFAAHRPSDDEIGISVGANVITNPGGLTVYAIWSRSEAIEIIELLQELLEED